MNNIIEKYNSVSKHNLKDSLYLIKKLKEMQEYGSSEFDDSFYIPISYNLLKNTAKIIRSLGMKQPTKIIIDSYDTIVLKYEFSDEKYFDILVEKDFITIVESFNTNTKRNILINLYLRKYIALYLSSFINTIRILK